MSLIIGKENTFKIETLIYENGDEVESISYIASGSVRVETATGEYTVNAGNFIALRDSCEGFYLGDYYAAADTDIMVFPADSIYSFVSYMETNTELHRAYYEPLCSMMEFLHNQYEDLYAKISEVYTALTSMHQRYLQCCSTIGVRPAAFLMPHSASLYAPDTQPFSKNFKAFMSCFKTPGRLELLYRKNPESFLKLQLQVINSIYTTYDDMIFYLKTEISLFASKSQDCLFYLTADLMEHAAPNQSDIVMSLLTDMKNLINSIDNHVKEDTGITLDIDYSKINFYFMLAESGGISDTKSGAADDAAPHGGNAADADYDLNVPDENNETSSAVDFSGMLYNLCEYGHMEHEFFNRLNSLLEAYIAMPDKSSRDDEARTMRRELNSLYFELYERVFFNFADDPSHDSAARLFLDFGVLDERLLTDEQLNYIANISSLHESSPCRVYRMSEWLTAIYNGDKLPSKNEFDKDYTEFIRDKKREEHLSSEDEARLLADRDAKVRYEINNLLKYNCRILSGNMLAFTPMLSLYDFESDLERYEMTSELINNAINDVLDIDYSVFYREQMYAAPEKKIEKEVIQVQVFPDVILFPVYGVNTVMWQELSGKRSNTPGRFLFPAFYRGNINDTMISLLGRFRWELCKSIMGTAWNNVIVPSLTAEYSDYIQFYRKNRDLSSEKKEALKNQISRCRNNMREVFISDYFQWIKYEANGAIRLNKVARNILATYCPFAKAIRDRISGQPLYEDAMKKFNVTHQKKVHELVTRIRALERNGAEITQEIKDTQKFYEL